jgi:hypothetical protein
MVRELAQRLRFINRDDIMPVFASQPLSAAEHKVSDMEADGGATVYVFDCDMDYLL